MIELREFWDMVNETREMIHTAAKKFNIDIYYAYECLAAAEYIWGERPELKAAKIVEGGKRQAIIENARLSLMEDLKDRINVDIYSKPPKIIRPKAEYTNRRYLEEYQ